MGLQDYYNAFRPLLGPLGSAIDAGTNVVGDYLTRGPGPETDEQRRLRLGDDVVDEVNRAAQNTPRPVRPGQGQQGQRQAVDPAASMVPLAGPIMQNGLDIINSGILGPGSVQGGANAGAGSQTQSYGNTGWYGGPVASPMPYDPFQAVGLGQFQDAVNQTNATIGHQLNLNAERVRKNNMGNAMYDILRRLTDGINNRGNDSESSSSDLKGFYDTQSRQAAALPGVQQTAVNTNPVPLGEHLAKAMGTPMPVRTTMSPRGMQASGRGASPAGARAIDSQLASALDSTGRSNAVSLASQAAPQNAALVRNAEVGRAQQGLGNSGFLAGINADNVRNRLGRLQNDITLDAGIRKPLLSQLLGGLASIG